MVRVVYVVKRRIVCGFGFGFCIEGLGSRYRFWRTRSHASERLCKAWTHIYIDEEWGVE